MIADSSRKLFDVVLIWKLGRFSRDRYDSAHYKRILKKNGVKVVSAKENISDGPEGIILESMLEGYAEYYSAELSEKIQRSQKDNALKCKNNGGNTPLGYVMGSDGILAIDPLTAPLVTEIFTRYDSCESISEITKSFNDRGLKTKKGKDFRIAGISLVLKNQSTLVSINTVIPSFPTASRPSLMRLCLTGFSAAWKSTKKPRPGKRPKTNIC